MTPPSQITLTYTIHRPDLDGTDPCGPETYDLPISAWVSLTDGELTVDSWQPADGFIGKVHLSPSELASIEGAIKDAAQDKVQAEQEQLRRTIVDCVETARYLSEHLDDRRIANELVRVAHSLRKLEEAA